MRERGGVYWVWGRYGWLVVVVGGERDKQGEGGLAVFHLGYLMPTPSSPNPIIPPLGTYRHTHTQSSIHKSGPQSFISYTSKQAGMNAHALSVYTIISQRYNSFHFPSMSILYNKTGQEFTYSIHNYLRGGTVNQNETWSNPRTSVAFVEINDTQQDYVLIQGYHQWLVLCSTYLENTINCHNSLVNWLSYSLTHNLT